MERARGRVQSRDYTVAVGRQVVDGSRRPAQGCREHGLAESLLVRWRKEYEARGEAAFLAGQQTEDERLARRVAEWEQFCGQRALENTVGKQALRSVPSRSGMR